MMCGVGDATMSTLSIRGLRPAQLKALDRKAKHSGQTTAQYVRGFIERVLLSDQTFDEILRPIREDFRKSGITEDELDQIVDRARSAAYRKRRKTRTAR